MTLSTFSFASPWMLLFLLPAAFAAWRLLRRARRSGIRFSALGRIPPRAAGWRAAVAALSPYLLLAGLVLLVVAAARPRTSIARSSNSVEAIAIAMTLDVSGSMAALDLTPPGVRFSENTTRLAIVKKLFAEFVERRPDDLIGLVTFGSYASARSPLTADHAALLHVLKGVDIPSTAYDAHMRRIGGEDEANTAIGDGLATALALLKKAKPTSKVVILLSDGLNNTGAVWPEEAAQAAAKLGIKVYALGVGTHAAVTRVLHRDAYGRLSVMPMRSAFDEAQLKSIAKTTGGTYYSIDDRDSLVKALEEIDRLEKTKLDVDAWDRWDEHFAGYLAVGALLVLAAASLSMAAARRMA